ncbi:MAG TPA: S41 family peptidase [Gemmatimonadaceae bacterium]|jgi:carboxyl-terminal processing protease|nr:S41 family peptidase [Gemmatimonadaceae bacterium]
MRLRPRTIALAVVPVAVAGFLVRGSAIRRGPDLFSQVFALVRRDGVDSVSADALYEKAARGLVHTIGDPYAELYTRDELASFSRENLGGAYGGLGMQIEDHNGRATISRVFARGPAAVGGLRPGDVIVAIDSASVRGWPLDRVSKTLLGEPGTPLTVVVDRVGADGPVRGRFVREIVHQPSVPFAMVLDGGIGYVPLRVFSESAAEEVHTALTRLLAQGARGIILDVRENGGGAVDQALAITNFFVPEGTEIASVRERKGTPEVYHASHRPLTTTVPVLMLIDGGSASATEIVAGALQDHDRALIVGTTSFGKGLVQTLFPLEGGHALKLTTGRWYTPNGRSIQKPRKLLPDGRLVEINPDSAPADTARHARPVFRSDHGRIVYGGGAITPDVVVTGDTLSDADRALLRAITPASQAAYLATYALAQQLASTARPDFVVQDAWRDTLFARWQTARVPVNRAQFDAGRHLIDRLLIDRVSELAFSDSAAFRRRIGDDRQLTRALELIRQAHTQTDLLGLATAVQRG